MSPSPQKEIAVKDIQSHLTSATAWLAWDFSHLDNETIFQLKKELAQVPAQFKVYKNSLISKALPDYSLTLQQPTALIFGSSQSLPKILNLLNQFQTPRSSLKRFKVG